MTRRVTSVVQRRSDRRGPGSAPLAVLFLVLVLLAVAAWLYRGELRPYVSALEAWTADPSPARPGPVPPVPDPVPTVTGREGSSAPEAPVAETAKELAAPVPEVTIDADARAPASSPSDSAAPPVATAAPAAPSPVPAVSDPPAAGEILDPARLEAAAVAGDAEAQYRLALRLRDGEGTAADPVRALAWLMQSAAREHAAAAGARDRLYQASDDGARVRAESLSRDLGVPIPAGWLRDPASGISVWAPSWYRNGTWEVRIEAPARSGRAHGPGTVSLKALLYGRSSRSHEGIFIDGYLMDAATWALEPEPLATDAVRFDLPVPESLRGQLDALWMLNDLDGLRIAACPEHNPRLFAVLADGFPVIEDEAVKRLGGAVVPLLASRCALDPRGDASLALVPREHEVTIDRGDTTYSPVLATLQLWGDTAAAASWRARVRSNPARQAHAKAQRERRRAQEKAERAAQREREIAAARARSAPRVRGVQLGMSLATFRETLGDEIAAWDPVPAEERVPMPYRAVTRKLTLGDGARMSVVFASARHRGQLLSLVYEQRLSNGPTDEALRRRLRERYGVPDREAGSRLTWWLVSATGEPLGAFLKARLFTRRDSRAVESLRLVLADPALSLQDESDAAAARRAARRAAQERQRSPSVKF